MGVECSQAALQTSNKSEVILRQKYMAPQCIVMTLSLD